MRGSGNNNVVPGKCLTGNIGGGTAPVQEEVAVTVVEYPRVEEELPQQEMLIQRTF